jgi:hypothetical protein
MRVLYRRSGGGVSLLVVDEAFPCISGIWCGFGYVVFFFSLFLGIVLVLLFRTSSGLLFPSKRGYCCLGRRYPRRKLFAGAGEWILLFVWNTKDSLISRTRLDCHASAGVQSWRVLKGWVVVHVVQNL